MDQFILALKDLHDQLGQILYDYEEEHTEAKKEAKKIKKVRTKKVKEPKEEKDTSDDKPVIRYVAPSGQRIKLHFDSSNPSVEVVTEDKA